MNLDQSSYQNQIWAVLPTYCEAENLPILLKRLADLDLDIQMLVVDDDSPDGTGDIAEELGNLDKNIHLIRRKGERGLGSAYLLGFQHALDQGADLLISMDCDLSHQPEAIPSLLSARGDAGCVVGSRYTDGGRIENWPKRRKVLSATANSFVRLLFQMPVSDCTSGYRIYRKEVVSEILAAQPRSQGYSFLVEALLVAVSGPFPVVESPICFIERTRGESKMGLREIVMGARALLALRLKTGFRPQAVRRLDPTSKSPVNTGD